ncbi:hypothetical protein FF011L_54650 [Roseimaritima multifibrata]|uniref:Uncharacterized protein n=2 Tax=Roseimaritima multifibrata TaxID=1930274 RepID=A0A517MP44_9BACT|nr:hypothetical protein FF011L_54650 [Roseimaritima multifibrata]
MPKALCLTSLAVAIVTALLFLADLVMGLAGMADSAPLRGASSLMDIAFLAAGIAIAVMSWKTYRELG